MKSQLTSFAIPLALLGFFPQLGCSDTDASGSANTGGMAMTGGGVSEGGAPASGGSSASGAASGSGGASGGSGVPVAIECPVGTYDSPLWNEYVARPNNHENIPNVSFAGYENGEKLLPNPEGPVIDVKVDHGAQGDGVTDDTAAIRAALESVGSGGGVVYVPAGEYVLSAPLFVHTDATVLRGEGRDTTKLVFKESLKSGFFDNNNGSQSRWSWMGGLISFIPSDNANKDTSSHFKEDWNVGSELANIVSTSVRGDINFEVDDATELRAGDFVFVQVDNATDLSLLKHLTGEGTWADEYDWSDGNSGRILPSDKPVIHWAVQIASVAGTTVTLKQPLRFDLREKWNPKLLAMGPTVQQSGIEYLTVEMERDYSWSFSNHHNKEPGWNGVWFDNVVNCFARDVTVVDPDTALGVAASKNVTVTGLVIDTSGSDRAAHHHGTTTRTYSQDILFENFTIKSKPWHGINIEYLSMGVVWHKGTMEHGTFDSHRALPVASVHTEISIHNDGKRGGAGDAGPIMGARFVNWNIEVKGGASGGDMITDADIMPNGAIVGVQGVSVADPSGSGAVVEQSGPDATPVSPLNLYEAQLALRLCE